MELPREYSNVADYQLQPENSGNPSSTEIRPTQNLSKNQLRKLRRHEQSLELRKKNRAKEREMRKLKGRRKRRGNIEKLDEIEKLQNALENGCKVVIDCQYQNHMSVKEQTRFAQQIRRLYSSNRSSTSPLHLYLASLARESQLYKICCKQNDGFANYVLDINEKSVLELFQASELVYLTPDADDVISVDTGFKEDKVYVIGGIVDETTIKNVTNQFAQSQKIKRVRLPIDEFFEPGESGTFKKVLTINQVVDIILEWHRTKDWVISISKGLPERAGFQPKPANSQSSSSVSEKEDGLLVVNDSTPASVLNTCI